jgi:hypothetical protein
MSFLSLAVTAPGVEDVAMGSMAAGTADVMSVPAWVWVAEALVASPSST